MICIIELLKEFSDKEIKRLEQFVNSPYHNKSKKLKVFFREIKKFYPLFLSKRLTKQYLSKKISPLKYNDSTFRNLAADLQSLIEKFLIIETLFENELEADIFLLKSLIEKKQNNLYDIKLRNTLDKLERNGIDNSYYYFKSILELSIFNNNIINGREKTSKNIKFNTDTINNYIVYLINFFITEIISSHLKLTVEDFKFNIGKKSDFTLKLISFLSIEKISQLSKSIDKDNFILELYLQLFLSFQNIDSKQNYLNYKSLVSKNYKRLSKDELSYHYSMLISYCVIKNSFCDNKVFYDTELFGIYNTFLKEKLFIDNKTKYIDENLFRNILVLSIRLRKFPWAFDFITIYSKYLHSEKKKNIINLSLAEYYFHFGSSESSLKHLNRAFDYLKEIQEESFIIKYDIRILYLMLYYDLGYMENLLYQLNSYRRFLCRNCLVPNEKKKKINCFLNILERLVYLKEGNPKIDILKLNYDIDRLKKFNYQSWLLNKIQVFNVTTNFSKLKQG